MIRNLPRSRPENFLWIPTLAMLKPLLYLRPPRPVMWTPTLAMLNPRLCLRLTPRQDGSRGDRGGTLKLPIWPRSLPPRPHRPS